MRVGPSFSNKNSKTGPVWNWSISPGVTCPGKTGWCNRFCYAKRGFVPLSYPIYRANHRISLSHDFAEIMIYSLRRLDTPPILRLHMSGDFYAVRYIKDWEKVADALPEWRFYGFTHSWRRRRLAPHLLFLASLPNVSLYASTDISSGPPVEGFKESGIERCYSGDSLPCPAYKRKITCYECGHCILGRGNVHFPIHSVSDAEQNLHNNLNYCTPMETPAGPGLPSVNKWPKRR